MLRVAAVSSCFFVAPVAAQSLALSYTLEARNVVAPRFVDVSACTANNWLTSIVGCGRELISVIAAVPESGLNPTSAGHSTDASALPSGARLLDAGYTQQGLHRTDGPSDAATRTAGFSRTADLMLRFGRPGARMAEEPSGRDLPRFIDANYETHVQSNAHKNIGIELLLPLR
jgi:hypothetical protein